MAFTVVGVEWLGLAAVLLGAVTGKEKGEGSPPPGNDDPDLEMIRAVLDGDPEAYRVLVERYERRIYSVIYGMVRNREDARDLAQDCFVKAYKNLEKFRLESRFYTWLCRIAMNLAIDHKRKMRHRSHAEYDDTRSSGGNAEVIRLASRRDDPSRNVQQQRTAARIMEALDALPDDQRQVVVLRELEGMAYREIAEVLDVPEGTVMSRLYYARRKLQELLAEDRPT